VTDGNYDRPTDEIAMAITLSGVPSITLAVLQRSNDASQFMDSTAADLYIILSVMSS